MSAETSDWKARPARKDEIPTLIQVFNRVYNKDKDSRTLEWKYLKNPHGESIMWVAEDASATIVGSVAFMPRRMRLDGEELLTFHGADAMVLPEWQRRGIITELLTNVYKACWERGAPLVHIFPNRRSTGALLKMGLHPVSLVHELELPLRGSEYFRRVIHRLPMLSGIMGYFGDWHLKAHQLRKFLFHRYGTEIRPVDRFDEAVAEAGQSALEVTPLYMVRDRDFLNWRYVDNPTGRHLCFASYLNGTPTGYLVMECASGRAFISDLLAKDDASRDDLLAFAVREALSRGGEVLQGMALDGDAMDRWLLEHRFKGRPDFRLVPLMINIGPVGEKWRPLLVDPRAWYIVHGDRDVEHMTP